MRVTAIFGDAVTVSATVLLAEQDNTSNVGTLPMGGLIAKGYSKVAGPFAGLVAVPVHRGSKAEAQFTAAFKIVLSKIRSLTGLTFVAGRCVARITGTAVRAAACNFTVAAVPDWAGRVPMVAGLALARVIARGRLNAAA